MCYLFNVAHTHAHTHTHQCLYIHVSHHIHASITINNIHVIITVLQCIAITIYLYIIIISLYHYHIQPSHIPPPPPTPSQSPRELSLPCSQPYYNYSISIINDTLFSIGFADCGDLYLHTVATSICLHVQYTHIIHLQGEHTMLWLTLVDCVRF